MLERIYIRSKQRNEIVFGIRVIQNKYIRLLSYSLLYVLFTLFLVTSQVAFELTLLSRFANNRETLSLLSEGR